MLELKANTRESFNYRIEKSRYINFVIEQKVLLEFDMLYFDFMKLSRSFENSIYKTTFFEICVKFLISFYGDNYSIAPADFVKMITRPGRRPKNDRAFGHDKRMKYYIMMEEAVYDGYINLIYTYAKDLNDLSNPFYSVNYFFQDFVSLIDDNMETLVDRYKEFM